MLRPLLSWRRWRNQFFSWMAGASMLLLAMYQPLHFWSMAVVFSLPAHMATLQKVSYDMSQEVSLRRYLLKIYCCSSSSQIFLQSTSPRFINVFALYLMDMRLRSMRTVRGSLSSLSRMVQQLWMRLWSNADQTITLSM